jgi:hypothetical protein
LEAAMTERSIESIKEAVIREFEKLATGEKVYSKAFSLYILSKYATLLYRLYKKAEKK